MSEKRNKCSVKPTGWTLARELSSQWLCTTPGMSSHFLSRSPWFCGFPGGSAVKNLPAHTWGARHGGSIPDLGRSSGEGNGNPFEDSCLGSPMNRRSLVGYIPQGMQEVQCVWAHSLEIGSELYKKTFPIFFFFFPLTNCSRFYFMDLLWVTWQVSYSWWIFLMGCFQSSANMKSATVRSLLSIWFCTCMYRYLR